MAVEQAVEQAAEQGGRQALPAHQRGLTGIAVVGLLVAGVVASIAAAVTIGSSDLSMHEVWGGILAHLDLGGTPLDRIDDGIVWDLRLPRVLTAAAVGAGLSVCGALLQALMRNPLADPYLLGISSGASLGAVSVLLLQFTVALPVAAFAGGAGSLALTLLIAGGAAAKLDPGRTILAGVAVSACCSAATSLLIFWSASGDSYQEILSWLLGSLSGSTWAGVAVTFGAMLLVGTPLLLTGRTLDAFTFGESAAASLGVRIVRTRWLLLGGSALLTSALVAYSGAIGFVGLVLPHAVRLLTGPNNSRLLPLSALLGAIFLVWADTAARTLLDPRELPVGIVTALVGTPAFAALLLRRTS
jgi:iron complex transport system permease protein